MNSGGYFIKGDIMDYKTLKRRINAYVNYWVKKGTPESLFPNWTKELKSGISNERLKEIENMFNAFKNEPRRTYGGVSLNETQAMIFQHQQALANLALMLAEIDLNERVQGRDTAPFPVLAERSERFTKKLSIFQEPDELYKYSQRMKAIRQKYAQRWTNPQARENLQKAILGTESSQAEKYGIPESKAEILADFLDDDIFSDDILAALFFSKHWNFEFIYSYVEGERKAQDLFNDLMNEEELTPEILNAWYSGGYDKRWENASEIKGIE